MPDPTPQRAARFQIFTGALRVVEKTLGDGTTKKVLQATASSTIKDRHGDEFTAPCVQKMAQSAKTSGMTIFLNHKYAVPEDVFGSTTDATTAIRTDGMETVTDLDLEMAVNETNPRSIATLAALEGGAKLGVSVGCIINEWHPRDPKDTWGWDGMVIDDVELLEASIVGIPANPRSWVKSAVKALKNLASGPTDDDDTNATLTMLEGVAQAQPPVQVILNGFTGAPPTVTVSTQKTSAEDATGDEPVAGTEPEATPDPEAAQPPTDGGAGTQEETKGAATEQPVVVPSQEAGDQETATTLEAAITQINAFASERTAWITERYQLVKERDEAREGLRIATSIVEKIASLPLGRKTSFAAAAGEFRTKLAGVYDDDFLKFLERTPES